MQVDWVKVWDLEKAEEEPHLSTNW
jgi:hypothetical protein